MQLWWSDHVPSRATAQLLPKQTGSSQARPDGLPKRALTGILRVRRDATFLRHVKIPQLMSQSLKEAQDMCQQQHSTGWLFALSILSLQPIRALGTTTLHPIPRN